MPAKTAAPAPLISIIIVTWNCRDYVLRCLETIFSQQAVDFEVIVRDNGSTDGSGPAIAENFPQVKLLGDGRNIGFSAANNEAINQARGSYLLLLNPDTELSPTTLERFIRAAQQAADQAMLVPTLLNGDGTLQPSRHAFPTVGGWARRALSRLGRGSTGAGGPVDWAIGACWFLPRSIFQQVGGLDANFFMYGEDLDYCWRVRQAGFQIVWTPQIEVTHFGNVSGQQQWGEQRLARTYRSLVQFWRKHFNPLYVVGLMLMWLAYLLAGGLGGLARQLRRGDIPAAQREIARAGRQTVTFVRVCLDRTAWSGEPDRRRPRG
jgi:hypothetical protein